MAYQVLARKWRPRNFPEMVGQSHVLRALMNALENNRLHHAYLFTGTRGVGKTTIARILAKSLNCEKGVTAYPCLECKACREIDEGRFIDLIEVDAASRTKVEDTRELLENVQYAPTRGRFKVYLIDEVHMLSTHSFNALLKTLEEPPPHVKFLLATTDPQKLPPTVLSRCLQFNLKRLSIDYISQQLEKIVKAEGVGYEAPALRLLAQAADGSLRDALSLLDQAIAYGGGNLSSQEVAGMLGTLDQDKILDLVKALAAKDAPGLLQQIAQLAEHNPDFANVLGDLLSFLQRIALAQIVPATIDANDDNGDAILSLAKQLTPEDVQLFYQIGILGRRDLPLAPDPRGGFEMVMLRMLAFRPDHVSSHHHSAHKQPSVVTGVHTTPPPAPIHSPAPVSPPPLVSVEPVSSPVPTFGDEWATLVHSLPLVSGPLKQLATHCALKKREGDMWHLVLSDDLKFYLTKKREEELQTILQTHFGGKPQRVHICVEYPNSDTPAVQQQRIQETREQAAKIAIENDPFIVQLTQQCDAQIRKVTPIAELNQA
jgi:DNA polymerase-3 subunit gamma/tau